MMNAIKWPITTYHLSKLLGLSENTIRSKKKQLGGKLIEEKDFSRDGLGEKYVPPWALIWHKSGAIKLALRSRSGEARAFLESERILDSVEVSDESRTIETIHYAVKGFTELRQQYPIGPYKVDIYLPDLNIVVECDEQGHSGYSQFKEEIREQFIAQEIGCKFIRYDPIYPKQVGKIINTIFREIFKK